MASPISCSPLSSWAALRLLVLCMGFFFACANEPIVGRVRESSSVIATTASGVGGLGGGSTATASGPRGQGGAGLGATTTKSPKRGIAYDLSQAEDFVALKSGVSWWYNWYFQSDAGSLGGENAMQFVPMLWGHNGESDYQQLEEWLLKHPATEHVLVMNEPNLVDQANILPQDAVSHWLRYEAFQTRMKEKHGRAIQLVGPALTWGTMPGFSDPIVWFDAFLAAFKASEGRAPRIDVLAFHWYDYGLDEQLTRLQKYGKSFWVTEMANWHKADDWTIDTPEKQLETMRAMVNVCESRKDVERYAWFMGRWKPDPHHTSLFKDAPGELTPLGKAYLTEPW